jgi:PEP-CTERM motif
VYESSIVSSVQVRGQVDEAASRSDLQFTPLPLDPAAERAISDLEGQVLIAPPNAILIPETSEPIEITDFINIRQFGERAFIQSDLDAVPEPGSLLLVGSGLPGLAGTAAWRKRRSQ